MSELDKEIGLLGPELRPYLIISPTFLILSVEIRPLQVTFPIIYPPYKSLIFFIYTLIFNHSSLKFGLGVHF